MTQQSHLCQVQESLDFIMYKCIYILYCTVYIYIGDILFRTQIFVYCKMSAPAAKMKCVLSIEKFGQKFSGPFNLAIYFLSIGSNVIQKVLT